MICNSNLHDKNCPSYNNALKGASSIQQHSDKKLVFNQNEISILSKVLRMSQIYLTKNKDKFNCIKDISTDISSAINILSARKNNQKIYLVKK